MKKPPPHLTPNMAAALLAWYDRHARALPWRTLSGSRGRSRPDPYRVLVSEIMLQQTTVPAVKPYFSRWMEAFPTVESLAAATGNAVLRLWEGLGYYSRVRNLHAAAREIVQNYGGRVPSNPALLRKLPGVGSYTAGAVASIAYDVRAAAMDSNALRVLSRLTAFRGDIGRTASRRRLDRFAFRLVPPFRPGDFNQAIMDLGASVCRPHDPECPSCPFLLWCRAERTGHPAGYPGPVRRVPVAMVEAAAGVVVRRGRVLVQRRTEGGLLAGMWEFPGGKIEPLGSGERRVKGKRPRAREGQRASGREGSRRADAKMRGHGDAGKRETRGKLETAEDAVLREVEKETGLSVAIEEKLGVFRHSYTRNRVSLHVFVCSVKSGRLKRKGARWVRPEDLDRLPMPAANRRIVRILEEATRPGPRPRPSPRKTAV